MFRFTERIHENRRRSMPIRDRYRNFEELSQYETNGKDYSIHAVRRREDVLVMAIHGGWIESGTGEIARAIADPDWSLYVFSGDKLKGNRDLHITSTRFDEPQALEMASQSRYTLSIHGSCQEEPAVLLGGRDERLLQAVRDHLAARSFHILPAPCRLSGRDPRNIANRNMRGMGLQIELSAGLRHRFFQCSGRMGRAQATSLFRLFVLAVRSAVEKVLAEETKT
jgi:phage replication-related protein YjqB (UPF0714/DUF867 family)